jgi:hypothetical protein
MILRRNKLHVNFCDTDLHSNKLRSEEARCVFVKPQGTHSEDAYTAELEVCTHLFFLCYNHLQPEQFSASKQDLVLVLSEPRGRSVVRIVSPGVRRLEHESVCSHPLCCQNQECVDRNIYCSIFMAIVTKTSCNRVLEKLTVAQSAPCLQESCLEPDDSNPDPHTIFI